jgi:glycosyltransferase involved in cell wall biosynthesis
MVDRPNVILVENAVNVNRFYLMPRNECRIRCGLGHFGKIVGYCGGNPSQRGAKELVRIAPELFRRHPDSGILIIGEDSDLWKIKEEARKSGAADQIIFAGVVDYHKVPLYMNCLDVGVAFDSPKRVGSVGNSSQKLRQYLACGVPVFFPRDTNQAIMQGGFGVGVSPEDAEELVEKICCFLGKSEREIDVFRKKAFQYACEHLSTDLAYEKRLAAWAYALAAGESGEGLGLGDRDQGCGKAVLR